MPSFAGFPAGKTHNTPLPAPFFTELLPQIDHLGELKVTLYVFWFLSQQEGNYRYMTLSDFIHDRLLMEGLTSRQEDIKSVLADSLERAVQRGTLLAVQPANDNMDEIYYFLNSPRGRTSAQALIDGVWTPDVYHHNHPELELERPNIFRLYEENIGALTPMMADILREAEHTYPADWIEEALRIAVTNNVHRWRYVEAILKSWQEKGRDGTDRRDIEKDGRKYLEGEFTDFFDN
jgi:DNA replication protein